MNTTQTTNPDREQAILDSTADLIMRYGYDKVTMSDIAQAVNVSRGTIYLHFENKEKLFEAIMRREIAQYVQTWLEYIEADPRGGTVGGIYRAVLHAINSRPIMAAMMRRDRHLIGGYLRKPDNLFATFQTGANSVNLLRALQSAGAVRQDVDAALMSHIMDIMSYGLITVTEFRSPDELPPFDSVMETLANMLDHLLTPAASSSEAGKSVIRQLAAQTRQQFEQNDR